MAPTRILERILCYVDVLAFLLRLGFCFYVAGSVMTQTDTGSGPEVTDGIHVVSNGEEELFVRKGALVKILASLDVNQVNAFIPIGCCTISATCTPLIITAKNFDLYGTTTSY